MLIFFLPRPPVLYQNTNQPSAPLTFTEIEKKALSSLACLPYYIKSRRLALSRTVGSICEESQKGPIDYRYKEQFSVYISYIQYVVVVHTVLVQQRLNVATFSVRSLCYIQVYVDIKRVLEGEEKLEYVLQVVFPIVNRLIN